MEIAETSKKIDTIKNLKIYLDNEAAKTNRFVIVPHIGVDYDALASAIGFSLISKKLKKQYFIVIDDSIYNIDYMLQTIIEKEQERYSIINREKYLQLADLSTDMFVLTDVNKTNRISLNNEITKSDKVIIIDHHDEDEKTVKSDCKCINSKISSVSEIMVKLLGLYKVKISNEETQYLLAGIYLDTNHLTKNVEAETAKVVSRLLECGASMNKVTDLFVEDFYSDRRIQELVSKAQFDTYTIAVILAKEGLYTKDELAKAADYLLKYKVDASFVVGRIEQTTIGISARSKSKINVGDVMYKLEGGGNQYSAATQISDATVEEAGKRLQKIIKPSSYINNDS